MKILVTGANGWVGSAIVAALKSTGHSVVGLVRSDKGAAAVQALGAEVVRGDVNDLAALKRAVEGVEGVAHTAYNHDFAKVSRGEAAAADVKVIGAIGEVFAGSNRALVMTSGLGLASKRGVFTEHDVADEATGTAHRLPAEQAALGLASRGVRAAVVRLPPSVHGDGDYAFVPMLVQLAREKGVAAYIGEGRNTWPAVHRLDAAQLYRLVLEKGAAGATYHGVHDEGVPTKDIAAVMGRKLNVPVVSKTGDAAAQHFGWMTGFLGLDVQASSTWTQQQLGWKPVQPGLLADLENGTYFRR